MYLVRFGSTNRRPGIIDPHMGLVTLDLGVLTGPHTVCVEYSMVWVVQNDQCGNDNFHLDGGCFDINRFSRKEDRGDIYAKLSETKTVGIMFDDLFHPGEEKSLSTLLQELGGGLHLINDSDLEWLEEDAMSLKGLRKFRPHPGAILGRSHTSVMENGSCWFAIVDVVFGNQTDWFRFALVCKIQMMSRSWCSAGADIKVFFLIKVRVSTGPTNSVVNRDSFDSEKAQTGLTSKLSLSNSAEEYGFWFHVGLHMRLKLIIIDSVVRSHCRRLMRLISGASQHVETDSRCEQFTEVTRFDRAMVHYSVELWYTNGLGNGFACDTVLLVLRKSHVEERPALKFWSCVFSCYLGKDGNYKLANGLLLRSFTECIMQLKDSINEDGLESQMYVVGVLYAAQMLDNWVWLREFAVILLEDFQVKFVAGRYGMANAKELVHEDITTEWKTLVVGMIGMIIVLIDDLIIIWKQGFAGYDSDTSITDDVRSFEEQKYVQLSAESIWANSIWANRDAAVGKPMRKLMLRLLGCEPGGSTYFINYKA